MANYNRIILAGNLTRDPELSYTAANTPVCKFGLAVNRTWTDRQTNERKQETMFVDCTAWARSAETINQYCRKGRPILIEGRLNYETWTNPQGDKRSKHTVTVDTFQFLGGRDSGGDGGGERRDTNAGQSSSAAMNPPAVADDDVPF